MNIRQMICIMFLWVCIGSISVYAHPGAGGAGTNGRNVNTEYTMAACIHLAFYGQNTIAGNRATVAVGVARPNQDPNDETVYYVAVGAATQNLPTTTAHTLNLAGHHIPAGTPRARAVRDIMNAVLADRGQNLGPNTWIAILQGRGYNEVAHPGGGNFARVVEVAVPERGDHLHAEMAITQVHAQRAFTAQAGHYLDTIVGNRPYCRRCYIFLRQMGANVGQQYTQANFGNRWDQPIGAFGSFILHVIIRYLQHMATNYPNIDSNPG